MQILLGIIVGAAIGAGLHFALPHRGVRGVVVGPMIGAAAGAIAWTVLTWAGLGVDSLWMWLAALVVPAVVTTPVLILLGRARVRADDRERARLGLA